jgi:hypothetical protein
MQRRELFAVLGGLVAAGAGRAAAHEGTRRLRARLVDRNGAPLPLEPVRVHSPGGALLYEGATDGEGRLDLRSRSHLPDGPYGLRVEGSALLYALAPTGRGQSAPTVCVCSKPQQRPSFTTRFPVNRATNRLGGRQFLEKTDKLPISPAKGNAGKPNREDEVFAQIASGNVPSWTEHWREIKLKHCDARGNVVLCGSAWVMPDYLSIGRDLFVENGRVKPGHDYVRMPISGFTAQKIANMFALMLPTEKVVDAVFEQADVKLMGIGLDPPGTLGQMGNKRFCYHEDLIEGFGANDCAWHKAHSRDEYADTWSGRTALLAPRTLGLTRPRGQLLVAGHKKDVVVWWPVAMGKKLWLEEDYLMFTGFNLFAKPPPQNWIRRAKDAGYHKAGYCDYSHGVRLMWPEVSVEGKLKRVMDVLYDPKEAFLLNTDGPVPRGRSIQYKVPATAGFPS